MEQVKEILGWYSAQVLACRTLGIAGDVARAKLDRDGGRKAREALDILLALEK
jgi:hypothetical protein